MFELLGLSPGLAQLASQGSEEPVKHLQQAVGELVRRVLAASTDMQGRLAFWGQPLLRDDELRDWRTRLEALKTFTEALSPYNTVGKLKNLRIGSDDIAAQKQNLDALSAVETLLALVAELGPTAAYLSQAELVLSGDHLWVALAQATRKAVLDDIGARLRATSNTPALSPTSRLLPLKKDYITAYVASHSKARLGVTEDKTKSALRKDPRLVALRALAGISLMPTSQLTAFEDRLSGLKSCCQLTDAELTVSPVCPHCGFKPANESLPLGLAANALTRLDEELDHLLSAWQKTLLDNLEDPIIQANFDLLKPQPRGLIQAFLTARSLPDPVTPGFVSAVQEALSGLEKIAVRGDNIKQALLLGGSPATPEDIRKRFETFLADRCKGKDTSKLRFVVE